MPAIAPSASRTQGQTGVDDDSAGFGEAVAETGALALLVGAGVEVELEVVVAVDVVVDVSVSVAVEVEAVEVFVEVEVRVDVALLVGATLLGVLGGPVVAEAIGVREGTAGRLAVRDPLGRFEPPPHDAVRTKAITSRAVEWGRLRHLQRTNLAPFASRSPI